MASLLSSAVPKITPESDIGLRLSLNFLGAYRWLYCNVTFSLFLVIIPSSDVKMSKFFANKFTVHFLMIGSTFALIIGEITFIVVASS